MRNDHEVAKQMVAKIQQCVNNPLMTCFLKGQSAFHKVISFNFVIGKV